MKHSLFFKENKENELKKKKKIKCNKISRLL